jgi:polyisoprenoid-binding protein YceI
MFPSLRSLALAALVAAPLAFVPGTAEAKNAKIDTLHSAVLFKAQHFGAGYTWGRFNDFSGSVELEGEALQGVNITVKLDSTDSASTKRDKHLTGPDFFDAATYPEMTFTSSEVTAKGDGMYAVKGKLSLHGKTQEITVDVKHTGSGKLPAFLGGGTAHGFETTFSVKQSDFGLEFNGIGDEVVLTVSLEVK